MLARYDAVTFAEVDRIFGVDRALRLFSAQCPADIRRFHEPETNSDVPKAFTHRLRVKTVIRSYPGARHKLNGQCDSLLVQRAHLPDMIGDEGRNKSTQPCQKDCLAGNASDLAFSQLPYELSDGQG